MLFSKILNDSQRQYCVVGATSGEEGFKKFESQRPDLVFLDLRLSDANGIDILEKIKKRDADIPVIILSGLGDVQTAVRAMKLGAYDYLPKPIPNDRLKIIVDHAVHARRLSRRVDALEQKLRGNFSYYERIIAVSPRMQGVTTLINKVASHDIAVLLLGETGTGKEIVSRAIHQKSQRKNNPFIVADCASFPETLIESELFGHERGAFTGATEMQKGRFEMADGGTLFLDEVGNTGLSVQAKLLRVLEAGEVYRLGGKKPVPVDVRVIAATNVDLRKAVREGEFREDLFHRLNVLAVTLPPLRERVEDLPALAKWFLDNSNAYFGKQIQGFSEQAQQLLEQYPWPGNVRELDNAIRSAVVLADAGDILPCHLPRAIQDTANVLSDIGVHNPDFKSEVGLCPPISLHAQAQMATVGVEKEMIRRILNEAKGNKRKAAKLLKIDYKTLFNKMKKYKI